MMRASGIALVLVAMLGLRAEAGAPAEASPATGRTTPPAAAAPVPTAPVLTAKERLSAKWRDEQRIDNCKVAPERRGPKPRPGACAKRP